MSAEDDKKLYETLGSLKTGMDNLNTKVDDVREDFKEDLRKFGEDLSEVKHSVVELNGKTVKQPQYATDVDGIKSSINNLRDDLARKKTRDDYPAVQLNRTGQFDTGETSQLPPVSDVKVSWAKRIRDNAAALTAILGLLGAIGVGLYKITKLMVSVETVLSDQKKEFKARPYTRVIYVKDQAKDSGAK
jgi:hypothetical protein